MFSYDAQIYMVDPNVTVMCVDNLGTSTAHNWLKPLRPSLFRKSLAAAHTVQQSCPLGSSTLGAWANTAG